MPQFWKGENRNGFRVRYAVKDNGGAQPRESDLVFVDERPFVVLEWSEVGAATVTVPAEPSGRLFDYSEPLIDPR